MKVTTLCRGSVSRSTHFLILKIVYTQGKDNEPENGLPLTTLALTISTFEQNSNHNEEQGYWAKNFNS